MDTTPPYDLIDSGQAVLAQLAGVALNFEKLDPTAPVAVENTLANRSGGGPLGLVEA